MRNCVSPTERQTNRDRERTSIEVSLGRQREDNQHVKVCIKKPLALNQQSGKRPLSSMVLLVDTDNGDGAAWCTLTTAMVLHGAH